MKIEHRRNRKGWSLRGLSLVLGLFIFSSSGEAGQQSVSGSLAVTAADASAASLKPEESRMWMTIGEHRFAITLADNAAARALAGLLPLTLDMAELNGNEKHGEVCPANWQPGKDTMKADPEGSKAYFSKHG